MFWNWAGGISLFIVVLLLGAFIKAGIKITEYEAGELPEEFDFDVDDYGV